MFYCDLPAGSILEFACFSTKYGSEGVSLFKYDFVPFLTAYQCPLNPVEENIIPDMTFRLILPE